MVYVDSPTYGDSSLGMNYPLNCSRVIINLTDRAGQISYLYDHQCTSTQLHASECLV